MASKFNRFDLYRRAYTLYRYPQHDIMNLNNIHNCCAEPSSHSDVVIINISIDIWSENISLFTFNYESPGGFLCVMHSMSMSRRSLLPLHLQLPKPPKSEANGARPLMAHPGCNAAPAVGLDRDTGVSQAHNRSIHNYSAPTTARKHADAQTCRHAHTLQRAHDRGYYHPLSRAASP